MDNPLKIGIIGCGAVTEKLHIPALNRIKEAEIYALADKDLKRIKKLQEQYHAKLITDNYKQLYSKVDIVIIALPNFLHAPVSIDFLNNRVHVFCEKPLAINAKEAKEMIKAAKKNHVKLGIGMARRYLTINQRVKQLIESEVLGKVLSFDCEEGFPFNWPLQSLYAFNKNQSGGGVLMDTGAHVVDLIIWLLGVPSKIIYEDDSYGGVETNCRIALEIGKIKGRIELSRNRLLRNTFKICCEKGNLEVPSGGTNYILIEKDGQKDIIKFDEKFEDAIYKELNSFINAISKDGNSFISGEEAVESVSIIDFCYKHKKQIYEPWFRS